MDQMLFLSSIVIQDIHTSVAFLTNRVKQLDKDEWGKLKCVLRYIRGTHGLKLNLSVDDILVIKWWVEVSYATH